MSMTQLTCGKRIAVVVPAFNAAATVRPTLESIQHQQNGLNRVAAVVLADDASSDETLTVASGCWKGTTPLQVTRNSTNLGERATINQVVWAFPPQIEWFFILHADDLAKPEWLDVMLRVIDAAPPNTVSVTASYDVLHADGSTSPGENLGENNKVVVEGTAESVRGTLKRGCWFKVSSCAIRVNAFRRLGGFRADMPQLGDWEFVLRVLRVGWNIEYIPLCLSVYRQSFQSVSARSFQTHTDIVEGLAIIDNFRQFLTRREIAGRHAHYMYVLTRRTAASICRLNLARLRSGAVVGLRVGTALCKTLVGRHTAGVQSSGSSQKPLAGPIEELETEGLEDRRPF